MNDLTTRSLNADAAAATVTDICHANNLQIIDSDTGCRIWAGDQWMTWTDAVNAEAARPLATCLDTDGGWDGSGWLGDDGAWHTTDELRSVIASALRNADLDADHRDLIVDRDDACLLVAGSGDFLTVVDLMNAELDRTGGAAALIADSLQDR